MDVCGRGGWMCVGGEGGCVWEGRVDVCGRGGWMCVGGEGGCVWEGRVDVYRSFVDRGRHLGQHCRMPTLVQRAAFYRRPICII